ncbi:MAG TPA: hypothetical protein QF624_09885 [Dehalococcoidia bacterium]|nr:hypothetical protein [Dehalococcoidia bacterium]
MTETAPSDTDRCLVCNELEPDRSLLEVCFQCDNLFHLNPRNDTDGLDHGDAWLGPTLGVQFYCQTCIDEMDEEARVESGDPAHAILQQLSEAGMAPPPAALPSTGSPATSDPTAAPPASRSEPPPRRQRPARRRRYRRIDGS